MINSIISVLNLNKVADRLVGHQVNHSASVARNSDENAVGDWPLFQFARVLLMVVAIVRR